MVAAQSELLQANFFSAGDKARERALDGWTHHHPIWVFSLGGDEMMDGLHRSGSSLIHKGT